jgi:hypothetical protein
VPEERVGVDTLSLMQDKIDQQLYAFLESSGQSESVLEELTSKLYYGCIERNREFFFL